MKSIALTMLLLVACWAVPTESDADDLPDVLFSTVQGQRVEIQRDDGWTMLGVLQGFDASSAVLILDDGSVVAVSRSDIAAIKLADAAAPSPATAPPPATTAPATTAPATTAPPPTTTAPPPLAATVEPAPMPSHVNAEIVSLRESGDALRRTSTALELIGVIMFGIGFPTALVAGVNLESANEKIADGTADQDDIETAARAPRNLQGGLALTIGGLSMVGTGGGLGAAGKAKHREAAALESPYLSMSFSPVGGSFLFAMRF